MFTLFIILGNVCAENVLTVNDVTIPSGSKAVIEIKCNFDLHFKGYQFDIDLDEGVSLELDEAGKPVGENGFATDHIPDFITFIRHHIAQNENQRVT